MNKRLTKAERWAIGKMFEWGQSQYAIFHTLNINKDSAERWTKGVKLKPVQRCLICQNAVIQPRKFLCFGEKRLFCENHYLGVTSLDTE